jgi:hypothetical protein
MACIVLQQAINSGKGPLNVPVDVIDGSFAPPGIDAMRLESPHDWETIACLFRLGANPTLECGDASYAENALAKQLKAVAQEWRLQQ